ncbi:threonine-phosphate decarboxylase CobD [Syntrophobacter fumaroxidans]|uniref:threonine-phosphate decarboxylase n=1 Tax=Syntrophobacter fumaroxidans (strain DSM 10017 / MPOB) TaxID=335543 RepID=A0LJ22_SYNFM|nr:threonine-phosphate decarboxylase CobD [Syntrophobacter fumaroxidans]ABK17424.1 L-threonine O-3-phosphate decarboxylase [Syntrophobacter fumaroxidans MPOB]
MTLAHGGNVYEISARLGCSPDAILDYSASINPLGPPAGLLDEFTSHYHRLQHYPDIGNRALIEAIAGYHSVSPSRVVVGNGSTELIYWLPRVLGVRRGVVVLPTFSEYQKAFELNGVELQKLVTSSANGFQPSVEQLEHVWEESLPETILFTHPGSPAGTLLDVSVRDWIRNKCRDDGPICILDEAFVDFCEEESLKGLLEASENLVIIRSVTKFYGLPGIRLGYLLTSEDTARKMRGTLPPWSVNTYAQIAGTYCFTRSGYREETLRVVESGRRSVKEALEAAGRLKVFPGKANYLLVEMDARLPPAHVLQKDLLASDRILIRDCRSFEGLGDHHFRVAIRRPEQNQRLIDGICGWLKNTA